MFFFFFNFHDDFKELKEAYWADPSTLWFLIQYFGFNLTLSSKNIYQNFLIFSQVLPALPRARGPQRDEPRPGDPQHRDGLRGVPRPAGGPGERPPLHPAGGDRGGHRGPAGGVPQAARQLLPP